MVYKFLKKLEMELPYNSEILLLDIYPKDTQLLSQKDIWPPMFITALFTVVNIWTQPKCSRRSEWIKKISYVHTYTHTMNEK